MSTSSKSKLLKALENPAAVEVLQRTLAKRRKTVDGSEHPFYAWRPRCEPWVTEGERPGSTPRLFFQRDIPQCKARMIGLFGANGIGKSKLGAHYIASRALGRHPLFTDITWTTPQMIWVCGEPKLLPGLFELVRSFIPESLIEKKLDSQAHQYLRLKNGSEIKFKSTGMDREEFQMDNVNLIWCDEEPPQKLWIEMRARLRMPDSQILLTFTPVNGTTFMHDTLEIEHCEKHIGNMEGRIALFSAAMEDNDKLPQFYIDDVKHDCRGDPDMYAVRVEGKYREMRGRRIFDEKMLSKIDLACCAPKERIFFDQDGKPVVLRMEGLGWEIWERPIPGLTYAACADLSEGSLAGDFTAAHVLCVNNGKVVARFHGKLEPAEFARDFYRLGRWYNNALLGWEKNYGGSTMFDVLVKQLHYPNLYRSENFSGKIQTDLQSYGFRTDKNSKLTAIQNLRDAIHDGVLTFFDHETVDELLKFGYLRKQEQSSNKYGMGAMSGHDDLVMALALTWFIARKAQPKRVKGMAPTNFGDALEEEVLADLKRPKQGMVVTRGLVK